MVDFPPLGMIEGEDSKYFSVEYRDNTVSSEMEDGYEISRPRGTRRPGRMFSTGFTDITSADKVLLQSFWESVRGNANLFNWLDPTTGQVLTVRFKGAMKFQYTGTGGTHLWVLQVELKEV
jgi:phage-related protein